MLCLKAFHAESYHGPIISRVSPFTEISLDGGKLNIGKGFILKSGSKIRVRKNADCTIGNHTAINTGCLNACQDQVHIGSNVQFGQNVLVYDHDHDFRAHGGIAAGKFKTSPISIGDNCWIGANTVILRGTVLHDNCIVGAGTVLKGEFPANSVIVEKREYKIKEWKPES